MNMVDSCGWTEYFTNGPRAGVYTPVIEDRETLLVPTICQYEVFKKFLHQGDEDAGVRAIGSMRGGKVVGIDEFTALSAAKLSHLHKLPMADSLILAIARQHRALLWTHDPDFKHVKGVKYIK